MSILIRGMDMPTLYTTYKVRFAEGSDGKIIAGVAIEGDTAYRPIGEVIPVPPHGRLIDADKITLTDIDLALCEDYKSLLSLYINKVESAQTIIEADKEGEG